MCVRVGDGLCVCGGGGGGGGKGSGWCLYVMCDVSVCRYVVCVLAMAMECGVCVCVWEGG